MNRNPIEPLNDADTPNEMRAEFERISRYDNLVYSVFDMARYNGFSGEDKYVVLAFNAIKQLKAFQKHALDAAMLNPSPRIIMHKDDLPT